MAETLPLLASIGIEPLDDISSSRKLHFETNNPQLSLLVLRGSDVLTYIRSGVADLGIVGKDMLLEDGGADLYELCDLGIAKCRLMTAGLKDEPPATDRRITVASKYVRVAKNYYASKGIQADVIKLYGGMELAPVMGLADEIVDIVDSGKTLTANGLAPHDLIAHISSRLVANKAATKVKHGAITELLASIESKLEA